jgi:hypothetical protein
MLTPISIGVSGPAFYGFSLHNYPIDATPYVAATGANAVRQDCYYDKTGYSMTPAPYDHAKYKRLYTVPTGTRGAAYPVTGSNMSLWGNLISAMATQADTVSPANEPMSVATSDYVALLKLTYQYAKAANPNVKVIAPCYYEGLGRFGPALDNFLNSPGIFNYFDMFDYHSYAGAPEAVLSELIAVQNKVAVAASKQGKTYSPELALTETGWTTFAGVPSSVNTSQLMDYWSFGPILFRAIPGLRYATFYTIHDEGQNVYSGYYGVYQGGSTWTEKVPGLVSVVKSAFAEAQAATSASAFLIDGVYYVAYTAPDQRLAIRSPAGSKTVTINTGTGPQNVTVGTRATYLKGNTYPDFFLSNTDPRDQMILTLQTKIKNAKDHLA